MQMLTVRDLFSRIPFEDPHPHITKVRSMCKCFVERPNLNRVESVSSFSDGRGLYMVYQALL